ncbi:redox-sensitive transcriptional activator SoxR [Aestuariibacter sp. A3R04]|uniref:redox-sensitive transcriptional activator SoxR n=1 Tax=Aestuariibacter sp. A3R04 TaxID=2841571 RepID=UPI001C097BBE|nr:redox-sensitive transcriptional activator SoxR [Aestuariibacter sp. A3R04]MBU3023155.1 redox-sensitive transcriptional activator SoxR [Aestuariibacter sp. A3R04]
METLLKVGEVAMRSGVSVSTLHFYENKGLIKSSRNNGNQRIYPRAVLRRVAIIKVAQQLGMSLSEIKEAIKVLPMNKTASQADWQQLSQFWHNQLEARIAKLTKLKDELSSCIGCGCLSMKACALRNPQDELAEHGAGPILFKK